MIYWWEIPLALLSFLFNKVVKFLIGVLYTVYLAFNRKRAAQWQVLSQETIAKPLSLPVLMTKAPRWNTHAIIGTLGPFRVQETVSLDVAAANQSAQSWIAIFYSFPSYQTIASLESKDYLLKDGWASLTLKPGKYTVGLRYYSWHPTIELPAVKADSKIVTASIDVDSDVNQFYDSLIEKKNWFHLWLHAYIFTLLKGEWLPNNFVQQEYLPVGATDTEFFYGYLQKEEQFYVQATPQVLKDYNIYLTIYDRSSFPVAWSQIAEEGAIHSIDRDGFYLFRLRYKAQTPSLLHPVQEVDRQSSQVKVTIELVGPHSC